MYDLLYQFLMRHKHLSLPGLGDFLIRTAPARVDVTNHAIQPPAYSIHFEEGKFVFLKTLYEWLAVSLHIGETEAVIQLNEFCSALKKEINSGRKIHWTNVGTLRRGLAGKLEFEADEVQLAFQQPVYAERVIHEDDVHTMLVGEKEKTSSEMKEWLSPAAPLQKRWWLWPAIAGTVVIILLVFYFVNRGLRPETTGNTRTVQPAEVRLGEGTNN